jgi:hypothetical protein
MFANRPCSPIVNLDTRAHTAITSYRGEVSDAPGPDHQVTLEKRGAFVVPLCSCGWVGTARQKVASARSEARDHAVLFVSSDMSSIAWESLSDLGVDAHGPAENDPDA